MSPPSPSSPSPFKRSTSLPSPTIKKSRSLPSTSLKTPKEFLTEHTRIIGSIRALDHVPTSLAHQTDLVKSLEGRLDLARWRMEKKKDQRQSAIPKRGNSIKRNESWRSTGSSRESIGWRLINKVSRRKGSTSDEEYVEDNPMRDQTLYGLEEELRQAKTLHAQLLEADRKHSLLRAELDRFYSVVLHLAELELPHKDELEERMNLAQTAYDRVQETFNSEVHALESLTKAGRALIDCQHKLQEAVEYCTFGLPGRGSIINTLEGVHALASVIQAHIQQAQYVSPAVARFAPLTIPQGFSAHRQQSNKPEDQVDSLEIDEKLNTAAKEMQLLHLELRGEREAALRRVDEIGAFLMQASLALVWNRRNLDGYRKEKFEEYMFKKQRELEELQAQQQVEPEKGQHRWVLVQEPKDKWDQHLPLQNPPPPPSPDPTQKMRLQKLYQAAFPSPQLDQSFPPTPISPPISPPIAVEANSISPTEMFFPFRTQTIPIQHELPISHKVTNQPPTVTNAPTSPTHYSPVGQQVTKLKRTSAVAPVKSAKFLDVKFDFDFEITLDHLDPPPVYS